MRKGSRIGKPTKRVSNRTVFHQPVRGDHSDGVLETKTKFPTIALCVEEGMYRFHAHESQVPQSLIHQIESESSFFVGDWFTRHSRTPCLVFDATRSKFPHLDRVSSLIISGSHHMVDEDLPWINELETLVLKCLQRSIPVLGVCFGHQLLSKSLGAQVSNIDRFMVGPRTLILNQRGKADWLFNGLPNNFPVLYSRKQAVMTVPPGATRLDTGSPFVDAIAYRDNVRGVQFHPELDCHVLSYALHVKEHILAQESIDIDKVRAAMRLYSADFSTRVLRNFLRISVEGQQKEYY